MKQIWEKLMTIKVIMPQMGESVYEGVLTKWLKKVGETVNRDEPLFEISTDKVDSEIPSPASGILSEILIPEGHTVQINTVLAIIKGTEEIDTKLASSDSFEKFESQTTQQGSDIKIKDETDEITEIQIHAVPKTSDSPLPTKKPMIQGIRIQAIRTSPLVRKIARENSVNFMEVQGTGLEGRITKDDILKFIEGRKSPRKGQDLSSGIQTAPSDHFESTEPEIPPVAGVYERILEKQETTSSGMYSLSRFAGESETVPMTPMRKAIAEHMIFSKRTSAHVNTVFEVDLHLIALLKQQHKTEFEKREGIPLTYTPFFAKALVDTVHEFPVFNVSISGDTIIYKKPINLGIAVALETGLIVPVVKNAHLKSFTGMALKIADLAERARTKRLKPEDVQDGTISITNPGRYGALFATPIISQPQVAILGIGGVEKRPVVIEDAIAIRPMVCLSLSFDHRVIDGAVADQFMARIKEKLQSWMQWLD
jgi:pyruvate dehydrogenase E2 component (dihydrolipoamide acetyltransferase)